MRRGRLCGSGTVPWQMSVEDGSQPSRTATTARDVERYAALFSTRTRTMASSAMRDLMAITERPEIISLAGGLPDTSTFPAEDLAQILSRVAADDAAKALQYSPTEGLAAVQEVVRDVMAVEGMEVDTEEILLTTGGQQVLDLVCKALIDPGDVIVAEAPTYPGAVSAFQAYQPEVVQVAMDDDGMDVDELEATLDRLAAEGRRPKFIYTIPSFQNPGGVTMSLARRRRLVQIAAERELLVLEDNPYGLLRYEGEPLPTLRQLDGGNYVIYLGTFSKILSPGVRVGWTVAPGPVLQKLKIGKAAADLCGSAMTQMFVAEFFRQGRWPAYLEQVKALYHHRRDVMLAALEEHLPAEATWTRPEGGLFLWATLPEGIDTTDLLAKAIGRHVAFVPGRAAYVDGRGGRSMRLNFSGVGDDDIREGVRRIGEVVHDQLALLGSLSGGAAPARRGAAPATGSSAPAAPAAPENVVPLPRRQAS